MAGLFALAIFIKFVTGSRRYAAIPNVFILRRRGSGAARKEADFACKLLTGWDQIKLDPA